MKYQQWILAAVLGAAVVPGCNKEETAPAPDATPPAAQNNSGVNQAPSDAADAMHNAANSAKEGANKAMQGANTTIDNAKQPASDAANNAAGAANNLTAEAQKKLAQVTEYIKENKLDLADKTLKEVEANEASLPASIKDQIPTVRKTLDAAKAANNTGMKMPDMGK